VTASERLSGRLVGAMRKGQYSIRVNDQFRICLRWTTEGPIDNPAHPGEVLQEDFMKPLGMSVNALAKALHVPTPRINEVVRKGRGVSADTAMRLARYFWRGCSFMAESADSL
jgi:addiction module HigA family antidote